MGEKDAEWEVALSTLRFSCRHKSNERVHDSLQRLMRVVVSVPYRDSGSGQDRTLITHLFDFFDLPLDENGIRAIVRFGLPKKLQPVLAQSNRWGRIKAEVVCASGLTQSDLHRRPGRARYANCPTRKESSSIRRNVLQQFSVLMSALTEMSQRTHWCS